MASSGRNRSKQGKTSSKKTSYSKISGGSPHKHKPIPTRVGAESPVEEHSDNVPLTDEAKAPSPSTTGSADLSSSSPIATAATGEFDPASRLAPFPSIALPQHDSVSGIGLSEEATITPISGTALLVATVGRAFGLEHPPSPLSPLSLPLTPINQGSDSPNLPSPPPIIAPPQAVVSEGEPNEQPASSRISGTGISSPSSFIPMSTPTTSTSVDPSSIFVPPTPTNTENSNPPASSSSPLSPLPQSATYRATSIRTTPASSSTSDPIPKLKSRLSQLWSGGLSSKDIIVRKVGAEAIAIENEFIRAEKLVNIGEPADPGYAMANELLNHLRSMRNEFLEEAIKIGPSSTQPSIGDDDVTSEFSTNINKLKHSALLELAIGIANLMETTSKCTTRTDIENKVDAYRISTTQLSISEYYSKKLLHMLSKIAGMCLGCYVGKLASDYLATTPAIAAPDPATAPVGMAAQAATMAVKIAAVPVVSEIAGAVVGYRLGNKAGRFFKNPTQRLVEMRLQLADQQISASAENGSSATTLSNHIKRVMRSITS
jgi:hypothetical protein